MSYSLTIVLHRGKPQSIDGLLPACWDKTQVSVDLHRVGRRIDCEHLMSVVTAHGLEQPFADSPALPCRVHKEAADVPGRTHGQYTNQRVPIESTVKVHLPVSRPVIQTDPERSDSFG